MKTKTNTTADPAALQAELERARRAAEVRRVDELERERAQARHSRDRADVATVERLTELERARREAAAESRARLARLYEEALEAGERTRIRSAMARSGEARALNLEQLRALNLKVFVPILIGLGLWSTGGVHDGGVRLMDAPRGSATWWLLWALEPALIAVVAWLIMVRARLAAAGGRLEAGAEWLAGGFLATSIVLNLVSAAPTGGGDVSVGAMLAHAIGPVGAAAVAYLIGVVDRSITGADPWTDPVPGRPDVRRPVPVLADLDLTPPPVVIDLDGLGSSRTGIETGSQTGGTGGSQTGPGPVRPVVWPVPAEGRTVLPIVARTTAAPSPAVMVSAGEDDRRTGSDQAAPSVPAPASKTRPNRGVPVPQIAKTGTRSLSDRELRDRLDRLIADGDVETEPTVRAVRTALGIGNDRAKRVLALRETGGRVVELHAVGAGGDG